MYVHLFVLFWWHGKICNPLILLNNMNEITNIITRKVEDMLQ